MYKLVRSVKLKPATALESIQIAQEMADYINKNYPQVKVQVYVPVFSELQKVFWFSEYENLSIIEEMGQKITGDEGYMSIVMKLADKIIEGSVKDELFSLQT